MSMFTLLAAYLLGGVTFVPLVLFLAFRLLSTTVEDEAVLRAKVLPSGPTEAEAKKRVLPDGEEPSTASHESDVASGFFDVCREFKPSSTSSKSAEKAPSATSSATPETASVYQSMYRSIFDRTKTSASTDSDRPKQKPTRISSFIILR